MTTLTNLEAVPTKHHSNWLRAGTAVTATSASEVASQAGLDWTVSLHTLSASYQVPGNDEATSIPVENKFGVVKTTPFGDTKAIGVVGGRYQVFQNAEVFSALDNLIDSSEARYAAAGEYDNGAKVWMLLSLPMDVTVAGDPHAAFILAKTSHDGSSSVVIKPIIERLRCSNQINKIYRKHNAFTYTLRHSTGSVLDQSEIRRILDLSYDNTQHYITLGNKLISKEVSRAQATAYFKKVFPLPSSIENVPVSLLSTGEKRALTRATQARNLARLIYENTEINDNIYGTEFGLWQSIVEYADHGGKKNSAVRAISGASDGLKLRALELLGVG